jgi:FkbM family methyltransferase
MKVSLDSITIDSSFQYRITGTNKEVVKDYVLSMERGDSFPPLVVFETGDKLLLVDGFHRYEAYQNRGTSEVEVEKKKGTKEEALHFARYEANRKNGMRMTNADKAKIVTETLLDPAYSSMSLRQIADLCKVTHPTVLKHKEKLNSQTPEKKTSFSSKSVTSFIGLLNSETEVPENLLKVLEKGIKSRLYGEKSLPLEYHGTTDFVYPAGSGSESAINEAYLLRDYGGLPSIVPLRGKVVMDCGGHIGCFSRRVMEEGAKKVHTYEPFPSCHEALVMNLKGLNCEINQLALTTKEKGGERLSFYYRDGRLEASSLVRKSNAIMAHYGYQETSVPTISFWDEVERIQPEVVKMDIEGEEWEILQEREFPNYVKHILIEVHHIASKGIDAAEELVRNAMPNAELKFKNSLFIFNKKDKPINAQFVFSRK